MKKISKYILTPCLILFIMGLKWGLLFPQDLQTQENKNSFTEQDAQSLHGLRKREKPKKRHGKIRGKIIDARSNEPLPGTNVTVLGSRYGAATDLNGQYEISGIPPGKYRLRVSMIGYKIFEKEVYVSLDKVTWQDFALKEDVLETDAIVITATGTPHFYENTPIKTAVIPRKLIEARAAENLADALALQTGVRVETNCQNCNFTQVRLLGMEGHYSQILIEGEPVVSSLAGIYGLEQIPEEMIERIEIVKGGGSALYGGSAVAGVINIITRRPSGNKINLSIRNSDIRNTFDNQIGLTVSKVNKAGNSGAYIFGSFQHRSPMDYDGDGFSEIGKLENRSAGLSWYYHPRQNNELFMQIHHIQENRRGGNKFNLPPHRADIAEAIQTQRWGGTVRWKHQLTTLLDYKTYFSFAYQKRSSYYGSHQDPNAYGRTKDPLYVTGLQLNYKLANNVLTTGLQYQQENLNDIAVAYSRFIDDTYTDMGIFLQDNLHFGADENAEIVFGVRYDKHSKIKTSIYSPRLAMRFKLADALTLRGGFSTGFKAPQIFDEDLHITQVGGEGQIIRNAENLREEHSVTFTSGLEYQEIIDDFPLRIGFNIFRTRLDDTFLLTKQDDPLTSEVEFYRINGKGATVKGVEADVAVRAFSRTEIRGGMTLQKSRWDVPDPDFSSVFFFRTPDVYGYFRVSTEITSQLEILFSGNYTGSMRVPHYAGFISRDRLERSRTFLEFDCNISYRLSLFEHQKIKLSLGMQNITNSYQDDFDKGVDRDAGYIYGPSHPRRFMFDVATSL